MRVKSLFEKFTSGRRSAPETPSGTAPGVKLRRRSRRASERGFTIAEVLLSIIVFTISVVGVVAMQRASIASENSAGFLRAGQQLGATEMEALQSRSFNELVEFDFMGNPSPNYPFNDFQQVRLFPYRGVPMDVDWGTIGQGAGDQLPPGMRQNTYRVLRSIRALPEGVAPGQSIDVQAIQIDVWVLWLEYQPSNPIPETLQVGQLLPSMIDPTSADFRPFVQGVHLATVRANDGAASEPPPLP